MRDISKYLALLPPPKERPRGVLCGLSVSGGTVIVSHGITDMRDFIGQEPFDFIDSVSPEGVTFIEGRFSDFPVERAS